MKRRAIVTGASGGIGSATAMELARAGAAVWLTYTNDPTAASQLGRTLTDAGTEAQVSRLDLRSPQSIDAFIAEVDEVWGSIHVLINNGGICPYQGLDDVAVDDWDAVLETNARGTFLMSRGALPLLRAASGDRVIINVASVAGEIGAITTGIHYAASKAAILATTRTFARLLATEGIRVNAVAPGPITSKITQRLRPDQHADLEGSVPLGRFGSPAEVAWIIGALAAPAAAFVTGATYDVNGGVRID